MLRPPRTLSAPSPPLTRREVALAALAACVLALVMHWPLPLHMARDLPRDTGDPLVQAWQIAWGGHALLHQPLDYFQSNMFWPLKNSLAFSDALTGYAPAGTIGSGVAAAVFRYNLLFLFAYALCFFGAWLLARELGVGRAGAAVAGAAYAYAPWRLEQDGHLHVISSGGIPLSLFLLVRGYRRKRPGMVLAGWLVAAWQLSLGFTLGLQLGYLLLVLGAIAVFLGIRHGRRLSRPLVKVTVLGFALFACTALLLGRPYMSVLHQHPEAKRDTAQVAKLSGPVSSYVAAPEQNLIWGGATKAVRSGLEWVPEQTLFPGLAILVLAVSGFLWSAYRRSLRIGLAVAVVVLVVLSLGFDEAHSQFYPYRLLYDYAPGWKAIRVPGRITTLTSLALALLAAGGAQYLLGRVRTRRLAAVASITLVALVCIEGSGFKIHAGDGGVALAGPSHPSVPQPPRNHSAPEPRLQLPVTIAGNRRYVLWSTDGFPKIVNGRGSFDPSFFGWLTEQVKDFPDRTSVRVLRGLGVRSVVLDKKLARKTKWAHAAKKPLRGLPLRRVGGRRVVVYLLEPFPGTSEGTTGGRQPRPGA